ncbi:MAG: L-2-hydroxyglutarate oxidase [Thermoanaerobaculia bacterium]
MRTFDVTVVGGGIVGLATARALAVEHGVRCLVVEAEDRLAVHQTGHNSGVIHSGLYYKPGSLKAELCAEGREAMFALAAAHGIRHERCGKVVIAIAESELPRLDELERRGKANGLAGIERLDAAGLRAHEPHAAGIAGLFVPQTGIVDYLAVTEVLATEIRNAGGEVRTGAPVTAIRHVVEGVEIVAGKETVASGFLVGCAGLGSDRLARLAGLEPAVRIVPFRGDYYELVPEARHLVRHLIYPVPDPDLPFLGVHFTRHIDGAIEAGPNAVLAWKREGYTRTSFSLRDAWSTLAYPGFWRMAPRYAGIGVAEYRRAWSRGLFVRSLQRLVPAVSAADVRPAGCGVRAQAMDRSGRLLDDFAFAEGERQLHVLNAPSPGATASLAIGRHLAAKVLASTLPR